MLLLYLVYYDVNPNSRDGILEILLNFTNANMFGSRLWEIRISQVPFSQRAPTGCLQYFTEPQGIVSTFNFAENGRHLANQNYNTCFQQMSDMCSIAYEPCSDQSFRIGPTDLAALSTLTGDDLPQLGGGGLPEAAGIGAAGAAPLVDDLAGAASENNEVLPEASPDADPNTDPVLGDEAIEGSGDADGIFPSFNSIRDMFFSFRKMRRSSRQLYSTCTDRITMPCIIEDFMSVGMGNVPACLPVHCGLSLCAPGISPCRVETSVTPFRLGIRFGQGLGKGSPEDNIGACLRYSQVPCIT